MSVVGALRSSSSGSRGQCASVAPLDREAPRGGLPLDAVGWALLREEVAGGWALVPTGRQQLHAGELSDPECLS